MMGSKKRHFASLIQVSLEDLVPADHFYRHLERSLDLSFVREFVQQTYAGVGRPSIDPVVVFKLHLVMFFEDIRSERLLMRHAADRLSVRWYLGYDFQNWAMRAGYDKTREDVLLAKIGWPQDGYRLFEIATLDESSKTRCSPPSFSL